MMTSSVPLLPWVVLRLHPLTRVLHRDPLGQQRNEFRNTTADQKRLKEEKPLFRSLLLQLSVSFFSFSSLFSFLSTFSFSRFFFFFLFLPYLDLVVGFEGALSHDEIGRQPQRRKNVVGGSNPGPPPIRPIPNRNT